jgi:DNA-directed RNA polymerase subunit RPC12/RpoP
MDVREKLVELLRNSPHLDVVKGYKGNDCTFEQCADWLISHGVTVQECAEWQEIEDDWNMETIYKCSACKEEFVTIDGTPADNLWNYCPHCGAKMTPQPPKGE